MDTSVKGSREESASRIGIPKPVRQSSTDLWSITSETSPLLLNLRSTKKEPGINTRFPKKYMRGEN